MIPNRTGARPLAKQIGKRTGIQSIFIAVVSRILVDECTGAVATRHMSRLAVAFPAVHFRAL